MSNGIVSVWKFLSGIRAIAILVFIGIFGLAAWQASKIELNEDISAFVPQDENTAKATAVLEQSGIADKIIIQIYGEQSDNEEALMQVADSLEKDLESAEFSIVVKRVNYLSPDTVLETFLDLFYAHLPVFLHDSDYALYKPLLSDTGTFRLLSALKENLENPASIFSAQFAAKDPAGVYTKAFSKLKSVQPDSNFDIYEGRIFSSDHKNLLLFITPKYPASNTRQNGELLNKLNASIAKAKTGSAVNVSVYGGPVVALSNSRQMKHDTVFTSILAAVCILLLLLAFYRSVWLTFLVFVPVLFGAVCSLGLISIFKGEVSAIAIAAGSIVMGIAINYALHYITHLKHEKSIAKTLAEIARPMLLGCVTTAGAFFGLCLVKSEALQQLGLFAGLTLIFSAAATMLVLPLLTSDNISIKEESTLKVSRFAVLDYIRDKSETWPVFLVVILLTIGFYFFSGNAEFDNDLMKVNYLDPETLAAEKKLESISSHSLRSIYLANQSATEEEVLISNESTDSTLSALKSKGDLQHYIVPSALIPSLQTQHKRIARWENFWSRETIERAKQNLETQGKKLGFKASAFSAFFANIETANQPLSTENKDWLRSIFFQDFMFHKAGNWYIISQIKTTETKRNAVTETLAQSPDAMLLDKQFLTRKFISLVKEDFSTILWVSGGLVFIVLLLSYGRIELTLINFLPMLLSWIWLLGLMSIFGLKFNIVNIIIGTLIFGLGDDYSIFVLGGMLEEFKTGKKLLPSFKTSIFLSAATTFIGVGVLIFATHPALKSIASVTIIGMVGVLVISLTVAPFLFRILALDRKKKGYLPYTASAFVLSFIAFFYFIIGCSVLNIVGFVQFKILRQRSKAAKMFFHRVLSWFTGSLVYLMANVKKKIINTSGETFEKPAIIISNHQSFLDILTITMLSPRMILLTNEWVWNSPFFGTFIKYADYLPVADGIEHNVEKIRNIVNQGYSVLVWPEGTRSPNGQMKRFHKGAFLLAKELGLEILPIIVHGTGHTMSKGDFLLKNGQITLKIMPRISLSEESTPAELAKSIGRWFRGEYTRLCLETETPSYYKEILLKNYIYKGPVLEWYARVKVTLEKNYEPFHKLVPLDATITDIGCGNGFMVWMLSFLSPARKITGLDYDSEKIEVAANISTPNDRVNFRQADIVKEELSPSDVFIMADVIHYLLPTQQEVVLRKMMNALNPDGLIILRDGDADLVKRQKGTWLTELFSTKLVGFNKTQNELHFISGKWLHDFAAKHQFSVSVNDDTRFTSNTVWVLKRRMN